jgi:hypothetical protein
VGSVQHIFHRVVIDSAILLRHAAFLTLPLLENVVGANDCKCSLDQQLNVPSEAWKSSRLYGDRSFWSPIQTIHSTWCVIHLQFDISANALEIRAYKVQSVQSVVLLIVHIVLRRDTERDLTSTLGCRFSASIQYSNSIYA